MTRNELIEAVFQRLVAAHRVPRREPIRKMVRLIINTAFDVIGNTLIDEEDVNIRGFGSFRARRTKPRTGRIPIGTDLLGKQIFSEMEIPSRVSVTFRPGSNLKELLKGAAMEKTAVVTDPEKTKTKTAGDDKRCPQCGSDKVDWTGNNPKCPNCGTKPWEPK